MAQSYVQVPPDGAGKRIDTWITAGATQHRQAIVIGDPDVDANVIAISSRLRLPVELEDQLDYDTGVGSDNISIVGIALPKSGGAVAGGTATDPVRTDPTGTTTQPISAASLPLPTGAATESTLSTLNGKVTACNTGAVVVSSSALPSGASTATKQDSQITLLAGGLPAALGAGGGLKIDGSGTALPISAASLPLPTGAATEATLSSLNGKVTAVNTGAVVVSSSALPSNAAQETGGNLATLAGIITSSRAAINPIVGQAGITAGAGAVAVNTPRTTLASDDPAVSVLGTTSDAAVSTDTTGTISAKLRGLIKLATTAGSFLVTAITGGDVAHDAADSGNPVKIGFKAANAFPTAVANADRANGISDLFGRQLIAHIDPAQQIWKSANYTTQQTGATIWDPTSGKKIAITSITIGAYGTTAARLILWIGANGDTTYTAGTDQLVFAGSYAPSTTSKPGTVITFPTPIFVTTADYELHITTDAALSVDIAVYGYEW